MDLNNFLVFVVIVLPVVVWLISYYIEHLVLSKQSINTKLYYHDNEHRSGFLGLNMLALGLIISMLCICIEYNQNVTITKYKDVDSVVYFGLNTDYQTPIFKYKLSDDDTRYKAIQVVYMDNVEHPYIGKVEGYDQLIGKIKQSKQRLIMDSSYRDYGIEKVYASNNNCSTIESLVYSKN